MKVNPDLGYNRIMKDIIKVSNKITSLYLQKELMTMCTTEDTSDLDGEMFHISENLQVCENSERKEWTVSYQLDGDLSFQEHTKVLKELFGEPTHPNGNTEVNNWTVKKILIVLRGDQLEMFRPYKNQ